jgi:hypothetical protein
MERGQSVEIEGLGTFKIASKGEFEFVPQQQPRIFLAYVEEDLEPVERLASELALRAYHPWVDRQQLLPGQNWPRAIQRAIESADFFLPLFSRNSVSKKGQFQAELRYALDCALRIPLEETFLVPVRLDSCQLPRLITQRVQYVDLFPDWRQGIERLCATVEEAIRHRNGAQLRLRR